MQMDLKLAHEEFERGITHTGFHYTMSLIKRKYKLGIIYCLMMNGPTRYNELKRRLEAATFRSLTNSLKELEADGLISRKEYSQIPPESRIRPDRKREIHDPLPGAPLRLGLRTHAERKIKEIKRDCDEIR